MRALQYCVDCLAPSEEPVCPNCLQAAADWAERAARDVPIKGWQPSITNDMSFFVHLLLGQLGIDRGYDGNLVIEEMSATVEEVRVKTNKGVVRFAAHEIDKPRGIMTLPEEKKPAVEDCFKHGVERLVGTKKPMPLPNGIYTHSEEQAAYPWVVFFVKKKVATYLPRQIYKYQVRDLAEALGYNKLYELVPAKEEPAPEEKPAKKPRSKKVKV
jgi:hypothetical protein